MTGSELVLNFVCEAYYATGVTNGMQYLPD